MNSQPGGQLIDVEYTEASGGSTPVGGRPDFQKEVQDSGQAEADETVAGSSKRNTSKFYQLKSGHCLTGKYQQPTCRKELWQCHRACGTTITCGGLLASWRAERFMRTVS